MNKKFVITSIALMALIAAGASTASIALADTATDTPVAKVKNWIGARWENLTEEQKAEMKVKMEEKKSESETRQAAVKAALEAGDYNAWVAAVGPDCPAAEKITSANFSTYVEAYNLMTESQKKLQSIGLGDGKNGMGLFAGFGGADGGMMGHRGTGMGMRAGQDIETNQDSQN